MMLWVAARKSLQRLCRQWAAVDCPQPEFETRSHIGAADLAPAGPCRSEETLDPGNFEFCNGLSVIEKTIDVAVTIGGEARQIRIEALRAPDGTYCTQAYLWHTVRVPPQPRKRIELVGEDSASTWVTYTMPWTRRSTADAALAQALSFLRDRCSR